MADPRLDQVNGEIQRLLNYRAQLRTYEKSLDARAQAIPQPSQFAYNNPKALRQNLGSFLPEYMMPSNVGGLNEVAWPFMFQMNFDLTAMLASVSVNSGVRGSFQIDQEACFILMSVSRAHDTDAANLSATLDAPLTVDIIDRQSSRRFETGPTPLQTLGFNSNHSVLPTGMLLLPNAFLDCVISGLPPASAPQNWSADGAATLQLSFFGYRCRIQDADKVLSTVFGYNG